MSKLTVIHFVGYESDEGGIIKQIRNLNKINSFNSCLIVSKNFKQKSKEQLKLLKCNKIDAEKINLSTGIRSIIFALTVYKRIKNNPKLIFHGHSRTGILIALILKLFGLKRSVATVHVLGRQKWFYKLVVYFMKYRINFVSAWMGEYYGIKNKNYYSVVPNSIFIEEIAIDNPSFDHEPPIVIGGIGEIAHHKGWHLLVEAIGNLSASEKSKIRINHIGSVPNKNNGKYYYQSLKKRILELNLNEHFTWNNYQYDIAIFFKKIDVLIVPSVSDSFSIVTLESLSYGKPVIISDKIFTSTLIEDNKNGFIFSNGDIKDLTEALRKFIYHPIFASPKDFRKYLTPYSSEKISIEWHKIYQKLLN